MGESIRQRIAEPVDITQLILQTAEYAKETGFKDDEVEKIKTAASELAHNIVKYAQTGTIYIRRVKKGPKKGLEIKASDSGPGLENIEKAMEDHFSSGKTLGLGLPGVKRLMDEFSIESELGKGTLVMARKWLR